MADDKKIIQPIDADFDDVARSIVISKDNSIRRRALFSGPLPIADVDLMCAVLDDETRVLVLAIEDDRGLMRTVAQRDMDRRTVRGSFEIS